MVGFADGLQKGFGLVNDVYERRSKDQYRQEVIADRKAERLADEDYRERAYDLEMKQFQNDELNDKVARETEAVQNETQRIINRKSIRQLDLADAEVQRVQDQRKTREALDNAALATNEIMMMEVVKSELMTRQESVDSYTKIFEISLRK